MMPDVDSRSHDLDYSDIISLLYMIAWRFSTEGGPQKITRPFSQFTALYLYKLLRHYEARNETARKVLATNVVVNKLETRQARIG